jgi:hypothetical protein
MGRLSKGFSRFAGARLKPAPARPRARGFCEPRRGSIAGTQKNALRFGTPDLPSFSTATRVPGQRTRTAVVCSASHKAQFCDGRHIAMRRSSLRWSPSERVIQRTARRPP